MNRRQILQSVAAASLLSGTPITAATQRTPTPRDYTGPFYPRGPRIGATDLVVGEPRADVLHLTGHVLAPDGSPHPGVLVDIWHADPNGRYKHPRDRGQDDLMDEFLYWGEATTDDRARFTFRTYVPGRYAARPAQHIHYKVWQGDRELLTSQLYFADLGGARGLARSDEAAALQTATLRRIDGGNVAAEFDIVI